MIRLRTLGTIGLADASGIELSGVLRQPKRFALLAYLALAGRGRLVRRDSLLALFWPELDTERARAALRQSLYTLRRQLPDEVLVTRGDEEVGVDPAIWCDVWAFEAALDESRPADALALYEGDLLPGFHVPDVSPDLGYWLDSERERLRRRAVGGSWALAEEAERRGDVAGVRRWASRAVVFDALDEEGTRRQITTLDRVGDRAGAVAAFDHWAHRVREELDLEPAPETVALVDAVRARSEARALPSPGAKPESRQSDAAGSQDAMPTVAQPDGGPARVGTEDLRVQETGRWHSSLRNSRTRLGLAGAAFALLILVFVLLPVDVSWRFGAAAPGTARVAVLPFDVEGSPEVGYLSDGLVYLLAVGLDGEEVRAVDPHALLRETGEGPGRRYDPAAAAELAGRFDAEFFVLGNVVGDEGRMRITAAVYARDGRTPVARATATGSGQDVLGLVDQLSAQILTSWRGPAASRVARVAAITTDSLPALKAYLHGERLLRRGEFDAALAAFQEAVQRDTTFALAFYRMSLAGSWAFRGEVASRAAERALRFVDRLPEQERLLLSAHSAYRAGAPAEAERLARRFTALYPEDGEGWYRLGEALLHMGPLGGASLHDALSAFEQAAAIDPLRTEIHYHLAQIASLFGDTASALDHVAHALEQAPTGARAPQLRLLRALLARDQAGWMDRLSELRAAPDFTVLSSVYMTAVFGGRPNEAREVARLLVEPSRPTEVRSFGHMLLASLELSVGRWQAAREQLRALEALDPRHARRVAPLLGTAPWVPRDDEWLRTLDAELAAAPVAPPADDGWWDHPTALRGLPLWYARRLLATRLEDTSALEALLRDGVRDVEDSIATADLVAGLRAAMQFHRGAPAEEVVPPGPVRSVGSAELAVLSPFISQPDRRYLQARLLEARGRDREALAWYESLSSFSVADLVYGVPALLDRARIHDRLGETEQARALRRRFLELWRASDPDLLDHMLQDDPGLRRAAAQYR